MAIDEPPPSGLLASEKTGDNAPPQSVGELSAALKRTVEDRFGNIRVRGEISGWKRAASGHCYFTLKDEDACIDAVLWRGQAQRLAFAPEDGAEVVASGKLSTYPGRSKYQVVVTGLELAGEGALMALLEKRRKAMAAEGLFAAERKQDLPYLPRIIGVVTSPTGAVIRDILHRLEDRCPTHVIVWPVPVQGEGAADKVATAIRGFEALDGSGGLPRPDLLIVARGGGSIEDLWAFNEEAVVRAAADCTIPLISAVGHETDTTLIDHVSDRRAPTPTAAAEMAVPVIAELRGWIEELAGRAGGALSRGVDRAAERQANIVARLPDAGRLLDPASQRVVELGGRLGQGLTGRAANARGDLAGVAGRLDRRLVDQAVVAGSRKLEALWRVAELAHPDKPLTRGFARVEDEAGTILTSAAAAGKSAALTLRFSDGEVAAVPTQAGARRPRASVAKKRRRSYVAFEQRGLFDTPADNEDDGDAGKR